MEKYFPYLKNFTYLKLIGIFETETIQAYTYCVKSVQIGSACTQFLDFLNIY